MKDDGQAAGGDKKRSSDQITSKRVGRGRKSDVKEWRVNDRRTEVVYVSRMCLQEDGGDLEHVRTRSEDANLMIRE